MILPPRFKETDPDYFDAVFHKIADGMLERISESDKSEPEQTVDESMMAEIKAVVGATLQKTADFNQGILENILDSTSRSGELTLSIKETKKKGKLGKIVFYHQDINASNSDPTSTVKYDNALEFAQTFVESYNNISTAHLEVIKEDNITMWKQNEDDKSWEKIQVNVIAIKHAKSAFFRNTDFYLTSIANTIFKAFVEILFPDPDSAVLVDSVDDLERIAMATHQAFRQATSARGDITINHAPHS